MSQARHAFDQAIALQAAGDGVFEGHTHAAYANMVGPFGGITAAQMLQAVWLHPERLGEPTALTVNFCAAVADGPFVVHAQAVRTNRSTQHWFVTLRQDDAVVASATAVTALRRATLRAQDAGMPQVPQPDQVPPMAGKSPVAWIDRYDIRYVRGGLPREWDGSDAGDSQSCGWFADEPARPLDFASLAALCDVFFPRVWLRRAQRVPIGTVSMTVYFHATAQELADNPGRFVLGQAHSHVMHDGFADQTGALWSEAGRCLATTHQSLYYKE
jgi:acyl-CoA thioesterase